MALEIILNTRSTSNPAQKPNSVVQVGKVDSIGLVQLQGQPNSVQIGINDKDPILNRSVMVGEIPEQVKQEELDTRNFESDLSALINILNDRESDEGKKQNAKCDLNKLKEDITTFIRYSNQASPEKSNARKALASIEMHQMLSRMEALTDTINNPKSKIAEKNAAIKEIAELESQISNAIYSTKRADELWKILRIEDTLAGEKLQKNEGSALEISSIINALKNEFKGLSPLKRAFFEKLNAALNNRKLTPKLVEAEQNNILQTRATIEASRDTAQKDLNRAQENLEKANKLKQQSAFNLQESMQTLKGKQQKIKELESSLEGEKSRHGEFNQDEYNKYALRRNYALAVKKLQLEQSELGKTLDEANTAFSNAIGVRSTRLLSKIINSKDEAFFIKLAEKKIGVYNIKRQLQEKSEAFSTASGKDKDHLNNQYASLKTAFEEQSKSYQKEFNNLSEEDKNLVNLAEKALLAEQHTKAARTDNFNAFKKLNLQVPEGFPTDINKMHTYEYQTRFSEQAAKTMRRYDELNAIKELNEAIEKKVKEITAQKEDIQNKQAALADAEALILTSTQIRQDKQAKLQEIENELLKCAEALKDNEHRQRIAEELIKISELDQ